MPIAAKKQIAIHNLINVNVLRFTYLFSIDFIYGVGYTFLLLNNNKVCEPIFAN